MSQSAIITKIDGSQELFSSDKLRASLRKAGADPVVIEKIVDHIEEELRPGLTTTYIYRHAYEILRRETYPIAARYSLRRALSELGPSGFPFEHFVSEVFRAKGYKSKVGKMIDGKCVPHEIDVLAHNDEEYVFAELKFHNTQHTKSDLKVALYVHSRLRDLEQSEQVKEMLKGRRFRGMIITNTKFTYNAVNYAECAGVELLSWSYPEEENLQTMVEEVGLHPITCLSSLSSQKKKILMKKGIVLCRSIKQDKSILTQLGLSDEKIKEIINEADLLCGDCVVKA